MSIFTKTSSNTISGTSSNDLMLVNAGSDAGSGGIIGGSGVDELRFTSTTLGDTLIIDESLINGIESVVIGTGTAAAAVITGTTALDVDATFAEKALSITGNAGDNQILGTLYADTITGGAGVDSLYGGADDDRFIVASGADHPLNEIIDGEEGFDRIYFTATAADTLTLRENDDIESVVIATAAGITTGTAAINVDASGMFNLFGVEITGNAGNNRLTGTDYADFLIGGAGNDTLVGGTGNDTLTGGSGADNVSGGDGDDVVVLTALADMAVGEVLDGGNGTDTLRLETAAVATNVTLAGTISGFEVFEFGSALQSTSINVNAQAVTGPMEIRGTNAANAIVGTAGVDTLIGGGGNDVFVIANATDYHASESITGGDGVDEIRFAGTTGTLVLNNKTDVERVVIAGGTTLTATATTANVGVDASGFSSLGGITLVGNAGNNALTGTIEADSINGGAGDDTILGGDGDDTLVGGAGIDNLDGGGGNDLYRFSAIAESATGELVHDSGGVEHVMIQEGVQLFDVNGPVFDIDGNPVWDTPPIYQDQFIPGEDVIEYTGSTGVLKLQSGTTGIEIVRLSAGTTAGGLDASLVGYAQTMIGNNGANVIIGSDYADTITGGLGADTLNGGAGDDVFLVNSPAELTGDVINGGAGVDTLRLGAGNEKFTAGANVNVEVIVGRNVDASALTTGIKLVGADFGSSTLVGGSGNDVMQGGTSKDVLKGGAGSDSFYVAGLSELAGDTIDGGAGSDQLVFTHSGSEAPLLGALLALAGINVGSVLLLGMGGQLAGIEEIRIGNANGTPDTSPSGLIADGSLAFNSLGDLLSSLDNLSLNQVEILRSSGAFDLLYENNSDFSSFIDSQGGLNNVSSGDLLFLINEVVGVSSLSQILAELLSPSLLGIDAYNPNFVTSGLHIIGSAGDNTIAGTKFADTIEGGDGNDTFVISKVSDHGLSEVLKGGNGNDELHFASHIAKDTLLLSSGVTGIEAFRIASFGSDNSTANVNINASRLKYAANLYGNAGNNTLTGTNYADSLEGGAGNDVLVGGRGNDTLAGGDGWDTLNGGLGNDTFVGINNGVGSAHEYVNGGAGVDTVVVDAGGTLDLTTFASRGFLGIEHIDLTSVGSTLIVDFSHVLESVGNGKTLTVDGGLSDTLMLTDTWVSGGVSGGYTSYTKAVGNTSAIIKVGTNVSVQRVFLGTTGTDTLIGTSGDDVLLFTDLTMTPGDSINGGLGNDTLQLSGADGLGAMFELTATSGVNGFNMTSIETIRLMQGSTLTLDNFSGAVIGSGQDDTIYITAQTTATIDGGNGTDALNLALNGGFASLAAENIVSIESISLTGGGSLNLSGNWHGAGMILQGGNYDLALAAGTQVGTLSFSEGSDTVRGAADGSSIQLGDGDNFWFFSGIALGSFVAGGSYGVDTIVYQGSDTQNFFLGDQGFYDGNVDGGYSRFESLDASAASGDVTVMATQSYATTQIKTGSGNDIIWLNPDAGMVTVNTGTGNDQVNNYGSGSDIDLGIGNDIININAQLGSGILAGGEGSDTLAIAGQLLSGMPLVADFSANTNQISGLPGYISLSVSGFENLDVANASESVTVYTGATGSSILTGSGNDTIYLGAGADTVNTGIGMDTVIGALTEGDSVAFGGGFDAVTFRVGGALAADVNFSVNASGFVPGNAIEVTANSGTVVLDLASKFHNFDTVTCATGADVTVSLGTVGNINITTFSGNDTVVFSNALGEGVQGMGSIGLGSGNDRASWSIYVNSDGGQGVDTVTYSGSVDWNFNLGTDSSYINFENIDASVATAKINATAVVTGSSLLSGSGNDILNGGAGADTLDGGGSSDILAGNGGNDVFLFAASGDAPSVGVPDTIVDFTVGEDQIALSHTIFAALGSVGALSAGMFISGDGVIAAVDSDDYLIYDNTSGVLYYDADGYGAGAAIGFATLTNHAALNVTDFFVV